MLSGTEVSTNQEITADVHTPEPEIVGEPQDNSEEAEADIEDVSVVADDEDIGEDGEDGEDEAEIVDVGKVKDNDESDSDSELIAEYIDNIEKLKSQNLQNILNDGVKKSMKYFNKKIRSMLTGTTQALQRINYSIGQESSSVKGKGKKRKIGKNINVQPTALARRTFPSKGKQELEPGRRQVFLNENDEEDVYFSLPKTKKRKTQQKHSLKESVDNNRPNPKKH